MNLPILYPLNNDRSTYITFSKSLLDFDKAISEGTKCHFSKMVALNLPYWENPEFYKHISPIGDDIFIDTPNNNFPKVIQYYMENIIRQSISINGEIIDEITELAFWKTLNYMGLSETDYKNTVTFINEIAISNFITTENNNGWNEIICQIPNKCKILTPIWKNVSNIKDTVSCIDTDTCLYDDNGNKQFSFINKKSVIDFDNCLFDENSNIIGNITTNSTVITNINLTSINGTFIGKKITGKGIQANTKILNVDLVNNTILLDKVATDTIMNNLLNIEFDFNVLLLYYTDSTGKQKLHGINFIYPFVDKVSSWQLPIFTQKTNNYQTLGYQFKFNQKSCNNEATQLAIFELQEHTHWQTFSNTLAKLDSFLEIKMREQQSIIQ